MKKWTALGRAVAMGAILLCSAAAPGESADVCAVPGYLLFGDSLLNRVNAAVTKEKELRITAKQKLNTLKRNLFLRHLMNANARKTRIRAKLVSQKFERG